MDTHEIPVFREQWLDEVFSTGGLQSEDCKQMLRIDPQMRDKVILEHVTRATKGEIVLDKNNPGKTLKSTLCFFPVVTVVNGSQNTSVYDNFQGVNAIAKAMADEEPRGRWVFLPRIMSSSEAEVLTMDDLEGLFFGLSFDGARSMLPEFEHQEHFHAVSFLVGVFLSEDWVDLAALKTQKARLVAAQSIAMQSDWLRATDEAMTFIRDTPIKVMPPRSYQDALAEGFKADLGMQIDFAKEKGGALHVHFDEGIGPSYLQISGRVDGQSQFLTNIDRFRIGESRLNDILAYFKNRAYQKTEGEGLELQ